MTMGRGNSSGNLLFIPVCRVRLHAHLTFGEVAEWFKAAVLKTVVGFAYRGFESLPLRHSIPSVNKVPGEFGHVAAARNIVNQNAGK